MLRNDLQSWKQFFPNLVNVSGSANPVKDEQKRNASAPIDVSDEESSTVVKDSQ